jgi:hypothetical protein
MDPQTPIGPSEQPVTPYQPNQNQTNLQDLPQQPVSGQLIEPTKGVQKPPHPGGRPTVIDEDAVQKLEIAFQHGNNVRKACQFAKVSKTAYYERLKVDEEFADRMTDAQDYWELIAADNITEVLTSTDKRQLRLKTETSRWVLEKKDKETFGGGAKGDGEGGGNTNNTQNNIIIIDNGTAKQLIQAGAFRGLDLVKLASGESAPEQSTSYSDVGIAGGERMDGRTT